MNKLLLGTVYLSEFTTFQLGGPCRGMFHCQTPQELKDTVHDLVQGNSPFILIGGGSNLVVSDQGLDSYVIRYVSDFPLLERIGNDVIVSGSTHLDDLAKFTAKQGLEGLNCATGIPGTVGGAIVGNAGAFGKQIGDVIKTVRLLSRTGEVRDVTPNELGFRYRHSNLKETDDMVLAARVGLMPDDRERLLAEREEILNIRRTKHPDLMQEPCAGSFFRNVEPTSQAGKRQAAGWFLEEAGGKQLKYGGAYIFPKHANIIVKGLGCTAQDVFELHKQMFQIVKDKFNLDLLREVLFVGKFDGMPQEMESVVW